MTATVPPASISSRSPHALPAPLLATVVLAGQAMASLDTAIVNVAAPRIQDDLRLTHPSLQAAVSAYVLVYAVGLVTGARLGARWGLWRTYLGGVALFSAASLACGTADSATSLVVARAVQGAGAALLVPQVLSLLQASFHGSARRKLLTLYGLVLAVGVAVGQVLGGVLVSADLFGSTWRPIFLVNLPVGLGILALGLRRRPLGGGGVSGPSRVRPRLDPTGALLLAAAVLALTAPLTFGPDAHWPWWCWAALSAVPVTAAGLVVHERRLEASERQPLLPPALFRQPAVRQGLSGAFVLMGCYGALLFTIALHLQYALHESALRSGLTFAFYAAGFAAASMTWSRLPAKWHPGIPPAGLALFALATGTLAWTVTHSGGWPWQATALLVVAGAGHGAGFGSLVRRTVEHTPPEHATAIGGLLSTVTQLAIVVGVSALGSLYAAAPAGATLPPLARVLAVSAIAAALTAAALTATALTTTSA